VKDEVCNVHLTEEAVPAPIPAHGGLAALFTGHILRDGEVVLLILKPSLWFIPLQSALFAGVVAIVAIAAALLGGHVASRDRLCFEAAALLIAGRLMWAALQWMGRLYVLTDQRILRLAGVFTTDVFDCPLRKVATARRTASPRESAVGVGSIHIFPSDPDRPSATWQTVARPRQVHAEIIAAIDRAKQ
jgi:hypothetical protein